MNRLDQAICSAEDKTTTRLRLEVHRSIQEIDATLWDFLDPSRDLSCTHRFLWSLEQSRVEDASYWYLTFFEGRELVGTAVLSAFVISLDLLNPGLQTIASVVRRVIPRFMRLKVLFCGLPISIGKNTLRSKNHSYDRAIIEATVAAMNSIAESEKISLLCAKEFTGQEAEQWSLLNTLGFCRALSLPQIRLCIRWPGFDDYLADLRSSHRRQAVADLRAMGEGRATLAMPGIPNICLVSRPPTEEMADLFFKLYSEIMSQAVAKLEVLNKEFFRNLFANCSHELEIIVCEVEGRPVGAVLLTEQNRTLYFLFAGLDHLASRECHGYFNLLYAIYRRAIDGKCQWIDMGQTSYWPKLRTGGRSQEMYFYLKSRSTAWQWILRKCNRLLFPPTPLTKVTALKSDMISASQAGGHEA